MELGKALMLGLRNALVLAASESLKHDVNYLTSCGAIFSDEQYQKALDDLDPDMAEQLSIGEMADAFKSGATVLKHMRVMQDVLDEVESNVCPCHTPKVEYGYSYVHVMVGALKLNVPSDMSNAYNL